jgi:hypothetical protein
MMRNRLSARSARRRAAVNASSREITIPLPLSGIFAQAKTAKVSNLYASELCNFKSNGLSLETVPGIAWQGATGTGVIQRIPFEFAGASLYIELSEVGATAGEITLARAFNGRAMWATNSAHVLIADGLGQPVTFNGTAFAASAFTSADGRDPAECDGIVSHHDRIYLWKTGGALEFLHGDIGAITGEMSLFPLGTLGNITGSILTMVSLTMDAGHGMNDVLCIITTTGQMVLYEGFDPSDPDDWRLLARVDGAAPVGPRAFAQVGSDAWMLTPQGPVSVGEAVRSSVLALVSEISRPICKQITDLIEAGGGEWQMLTARNGSMVVISRVAEDDTAQQFIYYMDSRSWSTANFAALDWHNLGASPAVTGFDGRLGKFSRYNPDEMVSARWVSSWFDVGGNSAVTYIKPTIIAEGAATVRIVVMSDRQDQAADIAEAEQVVTLEPEESGSGMVTLSDKISTDASGTSLQITLEITARWAEIVEVKAAIGS